MNSIHHHFIVGVIVAISLCGAELSDDFRKLIMIKYGDLLEIILNRADLGSGGSFGGGGAYVTDGSDYNAANSTTTITTSHVPIIFVHGIASMASSMIPLKLFYISKGYSSSELYATTYGPKGHRIMADDGSMKCEYSKNLRAFITAVQAYTNSSSVDLISYSMGVPVSRKAILGEKCVDTGEDLGEAMTASVNTFIGIAGPNHGSILCASPMAALVSPSCNNINGMRCGSKYLNDINSRQGYEGRKIYAIQTIPDLIVGNRVCGNPATSEIKGGEMITTFGQLHSGVWILSADKQYEIILANQV